ncbi:MAG: hypothetical protein ABIQ88_18380 [Chitinophagaceae bacterium]
MENSKKNTVLVLLIIFVTLAFHCTLRAQVNFQFMPALNGQTVNGLFTVQLQNTGFVTYNGRLKITVRDAGNKIVLVALTPSILIRPGVNLVNASMSQSRIQFGNSIAAGIIGQTGRFPEEEYEYCFEFAGTENKPGGNEQLFENCFDYLVQPMLPLNLVYPADGDEICNTRPELSWQTAIPVNSSLRYRLMLTEKNEGQQATDAILNNAPILQQDNINGCMLMYPAQAPSLRKGKQYSWQVIAYLGNIKMTQSEIWTFSTGCDERKKDSSKESYRQLSNSLNGNFYIAGNVLRFAISNPYNTEKMDYSITDIADPARQLNKLPAIKVQTGLNKIDIEMEDIKEIELNKMYLLTIKNIANQPLYLRFIYKGDAE